MLIAKVKAFQGFLLLIFDWCITFPFVRHDSQQNINCTAVLQLHFKVKSNKMKMRSSNSSNTLASLTHTVCFRFEVTHGAHLHAVI
jgi:hypothetical protein